MDLTLSRRARELREEVASFVADRIIPAEATYLAEVRASGRPHTPPPVLEALKAEARAEGLWNLFMPDPDWGSGLSNLDYAPIAEETGRSLMAPEVFNCNAPDTGNMELLARFGTSDQQDRWLVPLLEGRTRSCFAMTEPDVASSDATNVRSTIEPRGDRLVVNGRKWFVTNAPREETAICLFLGRSAEDGPAHGRHSIVLLPMDTKGITVERTLSVFGYDFGEGHGALTFLDVDVPTSNLLGELGEGFALAQARLGPGRIHHCMRLIGLAERALTLLCRRAEEREAFGSRLTAHRNIQDWIAESRNDIEQARLLTLKAAWLMDTVGAREARKEISMIKIVAPRAALRVVDRAIQVHGATGVSQDTPLAHLYAHARTMRIVDGPDEVHLMSVARQELRSQLA